MAEFVGSASKIAVLDFINGGLDDDRLEGGSGSDRFTASFGHDVIVGGSGGDLIDFGSLNTGITADVTTGLATYANALGSAAFSSITSLFGGKAADSFGGNALLNRLFGFGGTMR
ncbi:MAG: hypothetical protein H0T75_08925 [Rhizobiales bacterium]|nr:hypothetical protein [Hyphomicrobiales bacterium]